MFPIIDRLFSREKRAPIIIRPDYIQFFICSLIVCLMIIVMWLSGLDRVEKITLDTFFKLRPPAEVHQDIVIIEINNEGIRSLGPWPWRWKYHAEMIKVLDQWGAHSVVYDFIFTEEEAAQDQTSFAENLKSYGKAYFATLLKPRPKTKFWVHSFPIEMNTGEEEETWVHSPKVIEKYAKGRGHLNMKPDSDGVLRQINPLVKTQSGEYPFLTIKAGTDYLNKDSSIYIKKILPKIQNQNYLINWTGRWRESFKIYSFTDIIRSSQAVLQGRTPIVEPKSIKDKICLIGLSASDFSKTEYTPVEEKPMPRIGIQANILNSILNNNHIVPAPKWVNALCLLVIGVMISYLFINIRNVMSFVIGLGFGLVWMFASFLIFCYTNLWLYVYYPIVMILLLFIVLVIYSHIMANREKVRLLDLATRDGLTGLYVIRYFREVLNHVVNEAHQKEIPVSIILMDIDNFKPINDTYGHAAGDMVLKKTAAIVHSCLRAKRSFNQTDFAARYGGEEFVVLLRNSSLDNAADIVAERIRKAVEEATFTWEGQQITVTLSLGVSTMHSDDTVPDMMVRRADEALYKAKQSGKNKVCKEPPRR